MLDEILELFNKSDYKAVLNNIEKLEKKNKLSNFLAEEQYLLFYYKSRALERLGKFQDALDLIHLQRKHISLPKNRIYSLIFIIAELYALIRLGEYSKGLLKQKIAEEIILSVSEIKKEKKDSLEWIALYKNVIGIIYHSMGDLEKGLLFYTESLAIREQIGIKREIAISLNNIGAIFAHKGELENALVYYTRSFEESKAISNLEGMAYSLNNLGTIHEEKGDNLTALNYYKESLLVKQDLGNQYDIAGTLHNIGLIYHNLGEIIKALDYLQESLIIKRNIGNDLYTASTIHVLILIFIDLKHNNEQEKLIQELEEINSNQSNKAIDLFYRVTKALILKNNDNMANKSEAQSILTEIVQEEIILHRITLLAMINLCELLLFELKSIGNIMILQEARDLVNKLYDLAQKQKSYSLAVNVLVLQAQLAIIEGNLEIALEHLIDAEKIAHEKNLIALKVSIKNEKKKLESEFEKWNVLIEYNLSIQQRIDQLRLEEYTKDIKKLVNSMKN
jgi:tetratricopeptide (TPR) repeat protein